MSVSDYLSLRNGWILKKQEPEVGSIFNWLPCFDYARRRERGISDVRDA